MLRWELLVEGMVVMAAVRAPGSKARRVKGKVSALTVVGGRVTAAGREVCVVAPGGVVAWVPFERFAAAAAAVALGLNETAPRA